MAKEAADLTEVVDLDSVDDEVQCLTPISCKGSTEKDAILVENYADSRDLHRALLASHLQSLTGVIDLSTLDHTLPEPDHDVRVIETPTPIKRTGNKRRRWVFEKGESSNSKPPQDDDSHDSPGPTFDCDICVESKPIAQFFRVQGCKHTYCSQCIGRYIAAKLDDNVAHISCPVSRCAGVLHPDHCRSILPPRVFDRWGTALCDSVILDSQRFYCPFKDCSALLINDGGDASSGGELIRESECPYCHRLFCAGCKVPWHTGFQCADFQKLCMEERERDDLLLANLAMSRNWRRCPKCKFYVEKSYGCYFMTCRCGVAFCYNCGALNKTLSHMCPSCHH